MKAECAIDPVARDRWRTVTSALADAFFTDPVIGWLLPDPARRSIALQRFFAIETRDVALVHAISLAAMEDGDAVGAVLVLPPNQWRMPLRVEARHAPDYARIFGRRLGHALGVLTVLERLHPRYPHYYLPYIGVVSVARGQGVGSALLAQTLRRCDADAMPAYLEASSPDNVRLYRRHGFITIGKVRPLGAPPIELMLRRPKR
ncbi:GNAT family N-acetyltransferase [Mycobacteroides salmoniphilum]|uniref:GNAT family N-acetyltransferase n=1 Tax=Mycobacteroides salmoniphilum TaxID=404941 RepID=UPI001065B94D|nr:GNAT family N-acetyltransferase [Mycobacteroides salmoniphilum]TDZ76887.1 Acetyltransferase (GNAT) family protein [Mycobacteroides salmoniphilum]TDZ86590.1 Acetyltransferase (GNAT) family protein [Mycobacteroides salmoniphilum]